MSLKQGFTYMGNKLCSDAPPPQRNGQTRFIHIMNETGLAARGVYRLAINWYRLAKQWEQISRYFCHVTFIYCKVSEGHCLIFIGCSLHVSTSYNHVTDSGAAIGLLVSNSAVTKFIICSWVAQSSIFIVRWHRATNLVPLLLLSNEFLHSYEVCNVNIPLQVSHLLALILDCPIFHLDPGMRA